MAKIIKKTNGSKKSYRMTQLMTVVSFLGFAVWCALCAFVMGVLRFVSVPLVVIAAIFMIVWVCAGLYFKNRCGILKAGVDGEKIAGKSLSKLSKDYTVIKNAVVTFEGKSSEIDLLVFGKNGITIVESKNYKGIISGDVSDKNWTKTKKNGENEYTKKFYNPVKQLGTQIHRLSGALKENGVDVFIDGVVCFTNPESELNISGSKKGISVVTLANDKDSLADCITDRKNPLDDSVVKKLRELFGEEE